MQRFLFATTNPDKLRIAQSICATHGIEIVQTVLDIDEIQGEAAEKIVKDKARRAYELMQRPVFVSDDSWDIIALNGFPGPYMKSINTWFSAEDFLRLMHGVEERKIVLHQYLAYIDESGTKVYQNDIHGILLPEARGTNEASPNMMVTALDLDSGFSLAEIFAQGDTVVKERYLSHRDVWHVFCEQYDRREMKF